MQTIKTLYKTSHPLSYTRKKIAVVGACGQQAEEYMALLNRDADITHMIDPAFHQLDHANQNAYHNVHDLPKNLEIDLALICVPHYMHEETVQFFTHRNIPIIKEKPLATDLEQLNILKAAKTAPIFVTTQRLFNPVFQWAHKKLSRLGNIFSFEYTYNLAIPTETHGWRAQHDASLGGVVIDMGYHLFDVIVHFFGTPLSLHGQMSFCYDAMKKERLEDAATIIYEAERNQNRLIGSISINRHASQKTESLVIYGEKGQMVIQPKIVELYDRKGGLADTFLLDPTFNPKLDMLNTYMQHLENPRYQAQHFNHHSQVVACVDQFYQAARR